MSDPSVARESARTNGHANGRQETLAFPSVPVATSADGRQVVQIDPAICHPPDGQAEATEQPEMTASFEQHGQFVPGIVCAHPTIPGHYLLVDGRHRVALCLRFGRTFMAIVLDHVPTESELITIRETTDAIRKGMDPAERGASVFRWMQLNGKDGKLVEQAATAAHFCYKSQGTVSKLVKPFLNGIPELIEAIRTGQMPGKGAYFLATLPKDKQAELLPRCLGKKVTLIEKWVKEARGKKTKAPKCLTITYGGVTMKTRADGLLERLRSLAAGIDAAIKRVEKNGLPPDMLPGLLAS